MTNLSNNGIGQLLICGFDGLEVTEGILHLIRNHHLGAIIFFSRNIVSVEQVQRLTYDLQHAAYEAGHKRPLLIAVDQENGVVRRLGLSGTYFPGSMALGAIRQSNASFDVATATAKELLALGINWNLAPVLDVNNNPLNPVIGVRSYGEDPDLVAQLGLAQIKAYHDQKVATSIKHFPGHGDTATDSHLGIPIIDKSLDELKQIELIPFKRAIETTESSLSSIMIGHIALPQLIKDRKRPASVASEIVTDLLRNSLHYDGLVITDCLEMEAIKATYGVAQGSLMALQAGNDMAMISHTLEYQQEAIDLLFKQNIDQFKSSLKRVADLKDRFLTWKDALQIKPLNVIGCKRHLELSERLYDQVPTIVRGRDLPVRLNSDEKILFLAAHVPLTLAIDSEPEPFNSMYYCLRHRHSNVEYIVYHADYKTQSLEEKIQGADLVIIGTANANLHSFQSDLVRSALAFAKKLIAVAVINPYDLMVYPEVNNYIVTYEYTPPAHEAFVRLIFGETENKSRLPITIPNNITAHPFNSSPNELASAYELWSEVFGKDWPLTFERFKMVMTRFKSPYHIGVYRNGKLISLACTQSSEGNCQLALLMTHPNYRCQGIGTKLNKLCVDYYKKPLMVGSTYPRFFCGVPDNGTDHNTKLFFEHRGYQFTNTVWDLMGDLETYEIPVSITARMKKESISFSTIQPDELDELMAFQKQYFNYWVSTYQHHADFGDYQDLLVARTNEGKIVGSLVLYVTGQSHSYRTDLIWTELFSEESGGMACVGVAEEERGRGIGLGLVSYANSVLQQRGVKKSYVDWVELTEFYSRTGYQKWRGYQLMAMK